LLGMYVR